MPDESKDPTSLLARRFLSMVCKDALLVKAKEIAVAFDGNAIFRYKLYPEYKGQRSSGSNIYDYLQPVIDYLVGAGIHVIHLREYEGDDVLASLASTGNLTVGTGDKDAYQYLVQGVQLINPTFKVNGKPRPKFTTHKDVPKLIGLQASQALDYQTLVGDKIDNVPQLMTPGKAVKGLTKYGSLKTWLAQDPEFRTLMRKQKAALELNRKLVKLVRNLDVCTKPVRWVRDLEVMPSAYVDLHTVATRKTRSLF